MCFALGSIPTAAAGTTASSALVFYTHRAPCTPKHAFHVSFADQQPTIRVPKKKRDEMRHTVGKIPGVVYSNNTASGKGARGETFFVKVDKLVVDREIRRLKASFDNTVSYCAA